MLLWQEPILLLDEPFSALDPIRRHELQQFILDICIERNLTFLMVTHQLEETKNLFTRVVEIREGKVFPSSD